MEIMLVFDTLEKANKGISVDDYDLARERA